MDQCKHCTIRGDLRKCISDDCSIHNSWYAIELSNEVKRLSNAVDMVKYLTDCTLATVDSMAMKKSSPKLEYQRQRDIAQTGVDFIKNNNIDPSGTRVAEIIRDNITVNEYAKRLEKKWR